MRTFLCYRKPAKCHRLVSRELTGDALVCPDATQSTPTLALDAA